jgi:Uma2 family endonuclease
VVAQPNRSSLEEFLAMPDDGNLHELVRGEIRVMPPPKGTHGVREIAILAAIDRYLEDMARQRGWDPEQGPEAREALVGFIAGGEFGLQFSLPDDPHQIRGTDGAYVPVEQMVRSVWDGDSYFPEVPALVVEVISPSESAADVNEKVQDYLAGGARRVWCVYPSRAAIHIHDAEAPTRWPTRSCCRASHSLCATSFPRARGPSSLPTRCCTRCSRPLPGYPLARWARRRTAARHLLPLG